MKKVIAIAFIAMLSVGLMACESSNDIDDPDHVLNQDRG